MKNKGSAVAWVIIIIAIIVVGGGIYFYSQPKQSAVVPAQNQVATSTNMIGLQTYTNSQYGFSFQYPANYQVGSPEANLETLPNSKNIVELYDPSNDNILVTIYATSTLEFGDGETGRETIYFDNTEGKWMNYMEFSGPGIKGGGGPQTVDDKPLYTTANLPYFDIGTGISSADAVALSPSLFVTLSAADNGPIRSIISNIASTLKFTNQ